MSAITTSCAGCNGQVQPGALFCQRCGRALPRACAACGNPCESDFAFCPRCGSPQHERATPVAQTPPAAANDQSAQAADLRQVTMVFADLTGFTSLAEGLDPELLRAFQNALFEAMAEAIAHYDGFVEKFVGDAVMAVFGAPRAHEDDPLRAVEAARQMLQSVDALSRRWAPRLGREVTLHIGVHTGNVVAGSLGSGAGGTYAVTGDTVNTAARLLNAADPGSVLVSQTTHAMVRHRFDFAQADELKLRGKAQAVRAYRLLGVRSEVGSARGLADLGLTAPLVGREAAIAQLIDAFDHMQQGHAQLVSVVGEAGAGKSRLLAELFARLRVDERFAATGVRRVTCSPLGEPTYGTFGTLFRDAYRVEAGDSLEAARQKLHEGLAALGADAQEVDAVGQVVSYLLGMPEARPRDIEPEQLQRQIVLAARALIERRVMRQPLMIVIDDLQGADAASLDLLCQVVDQLADTPLMLLVSQRPDTPMLKTIRAAHRAIELAPLDDVQTRAMVDHLLGSTGDPALAPVFELVSRRAGGNPLFVEEIVRSLANVGLLSRENDRWTCEACDVTDVPQTLVGLLQSRVDQLGAQDRLTLQEAAVLGPSFDIALLRAIASEPTSCSEALARLAAADLLRPEEANEDRWRFTHAMLREVAYQNLLATRRTLLHERAGLALEAFQGAAPTGASPASEASHPQHLSELEALGHHWSLSADKPRGARYLMAAGDWARAVYANDDAIRHYERALRTLAGDNLAAEALDARERLAELLGLRGRRAEALAHCDSLMLVLQGQADSVRAARVLRMSGGLHWDAGDRDKAGACFDAGLSALGAEGDAIERAHLYQAMGRLAFRAGDNDKALSLAQRALVQLEAADAVVTGREREAAMVRAEASNTQGVALARLGRPAEAVDHIERSVAQAESHDLLQAACRGYTNLGVLYASLDPQRSIDTCLRGLETARKSGDLGFESRLYANLAVAYCALTNRCEAEGIAAANAAASLDRRLGLLDHLAVPLIVLGQIYQCHGDAQRAFQSYSEALQLAEQIDEPQLLFPCYDGLATLYLDAGQHAQAELWLAKAQAVCERAGLEPDALMVLPFLC